MAAWLIRLVEASLPPDVGEAMAGDLAEEWSAGASWLWLLRQAMTAIWRSSGSAVLGACAVVFVVAAAFELRRFSLTLIPFRERAEVGAFCFLGLATVAAVAVAGVTAARRGSGWPFLLACAAFCAFTPFLLGVPLDAGQTIVWAMAPFSGGAVVLHLRKRGNRS